MDCPRRHLLAASGGLLASLAGCLGTPTGSTAPDAETTATTTTEPPDYPATVNATTTIERGEIEYVEANDTVRYVAAYRRTEPGENASTPERVPVYEHVAFDEWAETECASVGAKRVSEAMGERLDDADGVSAGVTTEDGERTIVVAHQTVLNRDGEVVSEPTVPYDRVQRVAPGRAAVTITLAGRSHSCVVPVTTRKETLKQQ